MYKKFAIFIKNQKIKKLRKKITPSKKYSLNYADMSLDCSKSKQYESEIEKLLQENKNNPQKLFDYIKNSKTAVYIINNAQKKMSLINENEGFILPQKGLKALYINLILNKKISFSINEIFVIDNKKFNMYSFSYEFYRWYCFKIKAKGYEQKTQEKFKNIFKLCQNSKIDTLNFDEIIELKEAIKKDIEAINFVRKVAMQNQQAKKISMKIKSGKTVNV